ncbi:MAG: ABC transporter ATP-binding protein [Candidatus Cloacimonadota bacterium]|nr:ABC transporter ATP-binding protein [Candidatus Cloacimonadota bacterium]
MSLSFENINFRYNNKFSQNTLIFSNFSLYIKKGEKVGIFGKTGTGKTTLVKFITKEEKLQKGRIIFQNKDIRKAKNPFERISILFQKPEKQFVFPNIKDEIDFILNGREEETDSKINELAKEFGFNLKLYWDRNIYSFSPGELKLIQIILVLSAEKPYLILDDPFLFLDEEQIKIFKKILLNHNNSTILIFARNQVGFEELINREVIL